MLARRPTARALDVLKAFALGYPGAHEDHPWGETVVKVGKKVFVFLGKPADGGVGLSVKLPRSATLALSLPFASPTGYGLGKAGWVSAQFAKRDRVPVEILRQWIDESYRAVAPKTLVARLPGGTASAEDAPAKKKVSPRRRPAK